MAEALTETIALLTQLSRASTTRAIYPTGASGGAERR